MPAAPAPATSATSNGAPAPDDSVVGIEAMLGSGADTSDDDTVDDARSQYASDQKANLKLFKSQGGITQVKPTGEEVPATDAQGGMAYKPTTLQPVVQQPDGRFYRVDRTSTGNQRYFDIEDEGEEGADYHVDPGTGEKFIHVPAGNGQSQKVVVGQDPTVPAINALNSQLQDHQTDHQNLALSIDEAQNGVAGAPGLGNLPVPALRATHNALSKQVAVRQQIEAAQDDDNAPLIQNLSAVAGGQQIDPRWAARYANTGLIAPLQDDGGQAGYHLTKTGFSLLPQDAQQVVAANSLKYRLDDETRSTLAARQQPLPAMQTPQADAPTAQFVRQTWQDQQRAVLTEFPNVGQAGSAASQTFARAFSRVGNDSRKALAVARAVFGS